MKMIKHIIPVFFAFLLVSCFDDQSTEAVRPLAEIIIDESSILKEYNIAKNEEIVIKPVVSQTNDPLPLSYTWEIDQKVVGTADTLLYVGNKLGSFNGRLIVENSDGKSFHIFKLNVNSPYESGITVLSKDAEGHSCISFMQDATTAGAKTEFYDYNVFEVNNPGLDFASNASDLVQTKGSIVVSCQGKDGVDDDNATIYFLNEKTFVMENMVDGSEYPTFKPTKLMIPSESYFGTGYPVLSADGKMYEIPTSNAVLQPSHNLLSTYAQTCFIEADNSSFYDIIFWDKEVNGLALIYNAYGPFFCGSKYLLKSDSIATDDYFVKQFSKLKGVKNLTLIRRTPEQKKTERRELIGIAEGAIALQKIIVSTFFWEKVEGVVGNVYRVLDHNKGFSKVANKTFTLIDEYTPSIANATYDTMFFPNGNKVMKWYYSKEKKNDKENYYLEDSEVLCEIGSEKAVITAFEITDDHQKTYVAFYEPEEEGKNGSIWAFDTDTGEILEKYDNVCYQPVKIIYKKK